MASSDRFLVAFEKATPEGTSRDQGKATRNWLKGLLDLHDSIDLDLNGVEVLTPSFADECFGKLLLELGETLFREKIRVHGGNEAVKRLLNQVLRSRLAELRSNET